MRIKKKTVLIFPSGKMVCTGAKSEQQSKLEARKYVRIIQKPGFNTKFKDFKIQNIVGSCDVKFPIRLECLAYSHGAFSSYEPELFPGLIYRMKYPKIANRAVLCTTWLFGPVQFSISVLVCSRFLFWFLAFWMAQCGFGVGKDFCSLLKWRIGFALCGLLVYKFWTIIGNISLRQQRLLKLIIFVTSYAYDIYALA